MLKNKTVFILVVISLIFTSAAYAKDKVVKQSSGVMFGIRKYFGQLPPEIKYESLGKIEAKGHGGMAVEVLNTAIMDLCGKAKMMGANAVININFEGRDVATGEAVIVETFPDEFSEEDFEDFKGPKEYAGSKIFNYGYDIVFNAVIGVLEDELYGIVTEDYSTGIIETEPMEIPTGRIAWVSSKNLGGPYPVVRLLINIKEVDENKTEVTENYIFLKGTAWRESMLKKNNKIFFRQIKKKIRKSQK